MTITVPETRRTAAKKQQPEPRAEFITGLRQIADWLDAHPEVDLPYLGGDNTLPIYIVSGDQKAQLAAIAKAMGRAEKSAPDDRWNGTRMIVSRKFGSLTLEASADRAQVCERVVTGTTEVTKTVPNPELLAAVPTVEVTELVETVEWRCMPLLAERETAEVSA